METIDKKQLGSRSFTTETIQKFIELYNNQDKLVPLYLDRIRNGYDLTEEMMKNIEDFDNNSKMKIIREYNRCMKLFREIMMNS